MVADAVQFFQGQGQGVGAGKGHQLLVAHARDVDDGHLVHGLAGHLGGAGREAGSGCPFGAALDLEALDEFVGQQVAGHMLHLLTGQTAGHEIEVGGVHPHSGGLGLGNARRQQHGVAGGAALVVGHAGDGSPLRAPSRNPWARAVSDAVCSTGSCRAARSSSRSICAADRPSQVKILVTRTVASSPRFVLMLPATLRPRHIGQVGPHGDFHALQHAVDSLGFRNGRGKRPGLGSGVMSPFRIVV